MRLLNRAPMSKLRLVSGCRLSLRAWKPLLAPGGAVRLPAGAAGLRQALTASKAVRVEKVGGGVQVSDRQAVTAKRLRSERQRLAAFHQQIPRQPQRLRLSHRTQSG